MFDPAPPPLPAYPITPPPSLTEYGYHSQYSMDQLGITINVAGAPTDPDNLTVGVSMIAVADPGTGATAGGSPIFTATATRQSTGVYTYTMTAANSSYVGYFAVLWSFSLSAVTQVVQTWVQIGAPSPAYDALPLVARQVVEQVWLKTADGIDAPQGGPNLQQWMTAHFGRNRLAQLLYQTIQHLNNIAQPATWYTADGVNGGIFPYQQWAGLVNSALTVEVIKHLMRSYVEEPEITGAVQARASRRDYIFRWQTLLTIEQEDYKRQLDTWKASTMFNMSPRVLVSGGAYGNWSNPRMFNAVGIPSMMSSFFF